MRWIRRDYGAYFSGMIIEYEWIVKTNGLIGVVMRE